MLYKGYELNATEEEINVFKESLPVKYSIHSFDELYLGNFKIDNPNPSNTNGVYYILEVGETRLLQPTSPYSSELTSQNVEELIRKHTDEIVDYMIIEKFNGIQQIDLDKSKNIKITFSKKALEEWLQENPLFSTVHNPSGEYYTVTQEKQTQLTQMITLATLAAHTSQPFIPTWNSTSNVCEEWTIQELTALTFEITSYVLPRVQKQQHIEILIRECQTIEEVEAVEIDYATI